MSGPSGGRLRTLGFLRCAGASNSSRTVGAAVYRVPAVRFGTDSIVPAPASVGKWLFDRRVILRMTEAVIVVA